MWFVEHSVVSIKQPSAKPVPVRNAKLAASPKSAQEKKMAVSPNKSAAKMTTSKDSKIDEYPSCVQELVFNGFELEKAIQGYKMLGDNFDDIVLFLTSNTSIKELVSLFFFSFFLIF